MPDNDAAFLWETEALRGPAPPSHSPPETGPDRAGDSDWVTLRRASAATGVPSETVRKWARRRAIPSYLEETDGGQLRMVSLKGVQSRALQLGRGTDEIPNSQPATAPTESETPPGTMLVPIDAWDKMLLQLGNLHEAGQQLAEARERAAKAETEATFLKERLAEMRIELAETRTGGRSETRRTRSEELARSPMTHIPIESDEEPEKDDTEIVVRDLGSSTTGSTSSVEGAEDEPGMTIATYSLEMMKHLYSTWRGRPRR